MKGGKANGPEDKASLRLRDFEKARATQKKTGSGVKPKSKKEESDKNKDKDPKDQDCEI